MKLIENVTESKFALNNEDIRIGMPYILKNVIGTKYLVVLESKSEDLLVFNQWDTTDRPEKIEITVDMFNKDYELYKATSWDVSNSITIPSTNTIPPITKPVTEDEPVQINSPIWSRTINYLEMSTSDENNDLSSLFMITDETVVISQFLYKVTRMIDNGVDCVKYEVAHPISVSDERELMQRGFKVHPMFYDDEFESLRDFVNIGRVKYLYDPEDHPASDSLTIEIVSGMQLLYLIEFGLFKGHNATMYRGIIYDDGLVITSNAFVDCDNRLVIDNKNTGITIIDEKASGYIARFVYDEIYDWLFIPEKMSTDRTITDSTFIAPIIGETNLVMWGGTRKDTGIFRLWMHDDKYHPGYKDYIRNWYFTGEGK